MIFEVLSITNSVYVCIIICFIMIPFSKFTRKPFTEKNDSVSKLKKSLLEARVANNINSDHPALYPIQKTISEKSSQFYTEHEILDGPCMVDSRVLVNQPQEVLEKELHSLREEYEEMKERVGLYSELLQSARQTEKKLEERCLSAESTITQLESDLMSLNHALQQQEKDAHEVVLRSQQHMEDLQCKLKKKEEIEKCKEMEIHKLESTFKDLSVSSEQKIQALQGTVNKLEKLLECKDASLANLELELDFVRRAQDHVKRNIHNLGANLELTKRQLHIMQEKENENLATYEQRLHQLYQCIGEQREQCEKAIEQAELWKHFCMQIACQDQSKSGDSDCTSSNFSVTQVEFEELTTRYTKLLGHQNKKQKIHYVKRLKEEILFLRTQNERLRELMMVKIKQGKTKP